jgi:hypothetical protein
MWLRESDVMAVRYLTLGDVVREFDHVDAPDVLVRAASSPALMSALEWTRPRNWWGIGIDPVRLFEISRDTGIPLAWVPRKEIIRELASARDRLGMAEVLRQRSMDVVEDCATAIDECVNEWLHDRAPLAQRAIHAFRDGHHEASMALAVCLSEPLAAWGSTPRTTLFDSRHQHAEWQKRRKKMGKYRWAELELGADPPDRHTFFRARVVMAPIPRFFAKWFTDGEVPPPEALSRHVVAHQPTVEHFSVENALVAVMLMASLLRQMQDWCDEIGPDAGEDI